MPTPGEERCAVSTTSGCCKVADGLVRVVMWRACIDAKSVRTRVLACEVASSRDVTMTHRPTFPFAACLNADAQLPVSVVVDADAVARILRTFLTYLTKPSWGCSLVAAVAKVGSQEQPHLWGAVRSLAGNLQTSGHPSATKNLVAKAGDPASV